MNTPSASPSFCQSLRPFIALLKPHWPWVLCGVLLAVISILANIALLAFSGWFLAAMAFAGIAAAQINYFTPAAIIRFLALVRAASRYAERLVTHNATFKLLADLRVNVFSMLEGVIPHSLKNLRSAELLNRVQSDVETLDHLYLGVLLPTLTALICAPILIWAMAIFEPTGALLLSLGLLTVGVALPFWVHKSSRQSGEGERVLNQALRNAMIDSLDGYKELKLFGGLAKQHEYINQLNQNYCQHQRQQRFIACYSTAIVSAVVNVCVLLTLMIVIPQVNLGTRIGTELPMLCLLMLASFECVQGLPLAFAQFERCLRSARNIIALSPQSELSVDVAKEVTATPSPQHTIPALGSIEFDRVNFAYPSTSNETNKTILSDINFKIAAGETLAIYGPSGAGKSTLSHLINKFWSPDSGKVKINEQCVSTWLSTDLRDQVSTLSQHSYLFMGTIRDNLLMAKPTATDDDIATAIALAGLSEYIAALPNGLDTWIGETGQALSGGEARRLSLAQVLLRDSPVLILDEPTEGLDNVTKQAINQRLQTLLEQQTREGKGKAVLLITHDESQRVLAQQKRWLENGQLS